MYINIQISILITYGICKIAYCWLVNKYKSMKHINDRKIKTRDWITITEVASHNNNICLNKYTNIWTEEVW